MKNKDYKKFASVDKNLAHFYQMTIEKDGILIIDNRLAIPTKLRSACLNWPHRDHPGQPAMFLQDVLAVPLARLRGVNGAQMRTR